MEYLKFILILLAACFSVTPGQDVVAITIHPTAVSPGQTVKLDCRVDSKSSTTIMWYKRLNPDSPADVIGFNDQIFTDAYAPSMSAELVLTNGDTKLFRITIPNAKPEDTGDYACASATTESDKIPYLRLDIVEPLTSFNLYVYQTGSANDVTPLQSGSQLTLDKNRKYTIKCEALGSNPAADVQIQLINDISEQFDENIVSHLSGKEKDGALRAVKYGVTKQMDNFVPTRVINRQKLTCKALLPTKTDQSIDVTVITQSNVPVTIESSAHNVEVGESISILCNAKTLKLDDQVTWYRKRLDGSHDVIGTGEDIKNPLFKDRVISNDPVQNEGVQFSITIKDVRTQDSGEWGCSGVDADSTGIKYTDITIHDRSGNDDNTGESVHGAAGSCVFSSLLFASTLAFTMKANFS